MTLRWPPAHWPRLARSLAGSLLLWSSATGCGAGAGADPLSDPRIDETIKAVQAGKENPRKLRNLIKEKISGKEQEKALPTPRGSPGRRH